MALLRSKLLTRTLQCSLVMVMAPLLPAQPLSNYNYSVLSVVTSSSLDAISSIGHRELNPILGRGDFGHKQLLIKSSITTSSLLTQHFILRRHPRHRKLATIINYATSVGFTLLATRNWRLK